MERQAEYETELANLRREQAGLMLDIFQKDEALGAARRERERLDSEIAQLAAVLQGNREALLRLQGTTSYVQSRLDELRRNVMQAANQTEGEKNVGPEST